MKIRTDFVTNSSSSSFIIARKPELTEKQKEAIIKFVEEEILGKLLVSPKNTESEIKEKFDDYYITDETAEEVKAALSEGLSVYQGDVSFEETEYHLADLYQSIWQAINDASNDGEFYSIDTNLDY